MEALSPRFEVRVSVPSEQRSGTGHGFTFLAPVEVRESVVAGAPALLVGGLPSDAVKFAVCQGPRPDVVLAGINPGENAGVCAPYSGTVACAREAALWGIPAIALSSLGMDDSHYRAISGWVLRVLDAGGLPFAPGTFWNVNFPLHRPEDWGDPKVCRASTAMFQDHYEVAGAGRWRLEGLKPPDLEPGTDDDWLRKGHPALVPHRVDATDHELLARADWVPPPSLSTGAK